MNVVLCDVKFHTTLHWVKVIRNSEDCFPTSFDKTTLSGGGLPWTSIHWFYHRLVSSTSLPPTTLKPRTREELKESRFFPSFPPGSEAFFWRARLRTNLSAKTEEAPFDNAELAIEKQFCWKTSRFKLVFNGHFDFNGQKKSRHLTRLLSYFSVEVNSFLGQDPLQ